MQNLAGAVWLALALLAALAIARIAPRLNRHPPDPNKIPSRISRTRTARTTAIRRSAGRCQWSWNVRVVTPRTMRDP